MRSPPEPPGRASKVDRLLCSHAWLSRHFAMEIVRDLVRPGLTAPGPAYGIDLVALGRHAAAAHRHAVVVTSLLTAAVLAVVVGVPAAAVWWSLAAAFGVLVGAPLVALLVVAWDLAVRRARASRVVDGPAEPREVVPRLAPAVEERLAAASEPNVIVFGGGVPFVGAGRLLDKWQITLDTSKGRVESDGTVATPKPLSATDIHKRLTRAVRAAGIPDLAANNRLFVGGEFVEFVDGLLPDPLSAPRSVIGKEPIKDAIEQPTEDARTYLCMEKCTWGGELVVNVFVRAVLLGVDLSVVFRAFVLLPLKAEACAADDLPKTTAGLIWSVLRDTPRLLWLQAFVRPWRLALVWSWSGRLAYRRWRQRRRVQRKYRFNYGALTGIRERVAARQREWMYAYDDEERDVLTLQRRVLDVITTVVKEHNIDGSDLEQQQTNIVMNVSYKIDKVENSNVQMGEKNQMTTAAQTMAQTTAQTTTQGSTGA